MLYTQKTFPTSLDHTLKTVALIHNLDVSRVTDTDLGVTMLPVIVLFFIFQGFF